MANKYFQVRNSRIHGYGGFATRKIRKGTRIVEYQGERISYKEADARYEDSKPRDIILLFVVDKRTIIDAGVNGNEARFINHSCEPNCEAVDDEGRIYLEATRTIQPGQELVYDYNLTREKGDNGDTDADYACRCGAPNCRGTMLEPLPKRKKASSKKTSKKRKK